MALPHSIITVPARASRWYPTRIMYRPAMTPTIDQPKRRGARAAACGVSKRESGVIRLAGRTLGIMTERFRGAGHGARVRWPDPQIAGQAGQ